MIFSYQYYVLTKLNLNVKKACLVYINKDYIRYGELDIHQLFHIEDVTNIVQSNLRNVESNIESINDFMNTYGQNNEPNIKLGNYCFKPYLCNYWNYCSKDLPHPNVFDIVRMHYSKKLDYYNSNVISFEDLSKQDMNKTYLEQIDFELNNLKPKINKDAIKKIMDSLVYPLYFIDFETFQLAVPEYDGTKPYQQLPFQYSLHIIKDKNSKVEHKEFLAEIDDKVFIRHFAESMIKDIPDNGSVIIYNKSFEPARLNEIARMYPDLADELRRINSQMVDFLEPFKSRDYYMKEFEGSASIKKVLPALYPNDSDLDYHALPVVYNGEEASDTFLSLRGKSREEQEKLRNGLLVYCKLDTLAMVKIWQKFKEILEE